MDPPTVVGVLLAVSAFPALLAGYRRFTSLPRYHDGRLRGGLWCSIGAAAVVATYVVVVEGKPLTSAGVRFEAVEVAGAAVLGFVLVLVGASTTGLLARAFDVTLADENDVLLHLQPPRWKLAVAVVAGVTEEFVYRGYLIERLLELGVSLHVAGLLSATTFVLVHVPGRDLRRVVAARALVAVGLVVAYLLVPNAIGLAIAHAAFNATVFVRFGDPELLAAEVGDVDLDPRVADRLPDVDAA